MPQQRTLLHACDAFEVAHVRSHPARSPEWSQVYTVASRRIVFPAGSALLEVRSGGSSWLADGLTAIRFADGTVYQLRQGMPAARSSLVVTRHRADATDEAPAFFLLSPRSLYQVHAAQRQLRADGCGAARVASLVGELPALRRQVPQAGATARARRLLAQAAQTAHGEPRMSLHDVADAVSRSPFHLARSFRQQTGLSLHQYRQHLRLAAAMERLADGDHELAGIAHDLGFCSQSHLGAVFRRETGVTLGEARRVLGSARI
jgi:AraC-like DNA-binding protein